MDRRWDPDVEATWDAFFDNRRQRELAKFEGDGPPPVNNNEAGRRLWWGGRDLTAVMEYIAAGDYPRLRYPHFPRASRAAGFPRPPQRPQPMPRPGWQVPPDYIATASQYRRPSDPEEFPGQTATLRASLSPMRMARRAPFEARSTVPPRRRDNDDDDDFPNYDEDDDP